MVAGGKRKGAGRKPAEKTVQMRIPVGMVGLVSELIKGHKGQADEYSEALLVKMLDQYSEKIWNFDFSATLNGERLKFFATRNLRERYYEPECSDREKFVYEFLNEEI